MNFFASFLVALCSMNHVASQYVTVFAGKEGSNILEGHRRAIGIFGLETMQIDSQGNLNYASRGVNGNQMEGYVSRIARNEINSLYIRPPLLLPNIRLSDRNELHVVEFMSGSVKKYTSSNQFSELGKNGGSTSIEIKGNDAYALSSSNANIMKISPNKEQEYLVTSESRQLKDPNFMKFDKKKEILFVADTQNHAIKKVDFSGIITTMVGCGKAGSNNGPLSSACLNQPTLLDWDSKGNMYVADHGNGKIRMVSTNGSVSDFISLERVRPFIGVLVDPFDNLFISSGDVIFKIATRSPNDVDILDGKSVSINRDNIIRMVRLPELIDVSFDLAISSNSINGNIIRFIKSGAEKKNSLSIGESMLEVSFDSTAKTLLVSVDISVGNVFGKLTLQSTRALSLATTDRIRLTVNNNAVKLVINNQDSGQLSLPQGSRTLSGDALVYTSDPWSNSASGTISKIHVVSPKK